MILIKIKLFELFKKNENLSWSFIDKVSRLGFQFCVQLILARKIDIEIFGAWNYSNAIVAILSPLVFLGFEALLAKELICGKKKKKNILINAFFLRIIGGILVTIISILLVVNYKSSWIIFFILSSSFLQCLSCFEIFDYYYFSINNFKTPALTKFIVYLSFFITRLLFYKYLSVQFFILINVLEFFTYSLIIVLQFAVKYKIKFELFLPDFSTAKYLLKQSLPLILSSAVVIIFLKTNQLIIEKFLGLKEIGYYSVAVRIAELWNLIPTFIAPVMLTKMLYIKQESYSMYLNYCKKMFSLLYLIPISIIIFNFFFSSTLLNYLYGNKYQEANNIVIILSFTTLLTFPGTLRANMFNIDGLSIYNLYSAIIGMLILIPSCIFFVQHFGVQGAAYSLVLSYFFSSFLSSFIFKKTRMIGWLHIKSLLFSK